MKAHLTTHDNLVHKKLKPFKCKECVASFGQRQALKIHMSSVHLKLKPYSCGQCEKSFSTESNLFRQGKSTYWSPHLSTLFHFFKIHGWAYVKLRKENQECGNFLKMCCALLKIGAFDENHRTASSTLSLNLQLINFLSFWA